MKRLFKIHLLRPEKPWLGFKISSTCLWEWWKLNVLLLMYFDFSKFLQMANHVRVVPPSLKLLKKKYVLLGADLQRSISTKTILWFLCLSILLWWCNHKICHHQVVGSLNNWRIRRTQEAQGRASPDLRLQDIAKA